MDEVRILEKVFETILREKKIGKKFNNVVKNSMHKKRPVLIYNI